MGAKASKSEQLTRKKSLSTLGRSSQRSLFQKCKVKLNRVSKQIDNTDSSNTAGVGGIKTDLDDVERELNELSDTVKIKNQEKYDEVLRNLHGTRKKYEDKFKVTEEQNEIILRNNDEPKKLSVTFRETVSEESFDLSEEPRKPSVKFGVQVLPPSPQSQVLLKRKTYPVNSPPRNDVINRNTTDGGFRHLQNFVTIESTTSFSSQTDHSKTVLDLEAVNNRINELEGMLRYFTGSKESQKYKDLEEGFISNLALVEAIDDDEEPIAKQEKKILKQRIIELLKILECLVEQINGDCVGQFMPHEKLEDRSRFLSSVTAI